MDNNCQPENAAPTNEQYDGAAIKDITLYGGSPRYPTHIGIRLADGKYLEVKPSLAKSSCCISAKLEVSRGGWLEGPGDSRS